MGRILVGTSGYVYRDWRGVLYPEDLPQRDWLTYYARHFGTVELNATFYRQFSKEVVGGWRDRVPDDFRFTLKGHRVITHRKRIRDVGDELARFLDEAAWLGDALACVLWQFPKNFVLKQDGENLARLEEFVARLPTRCHQVFEFRHASWFVDDVFRLLDRTGAGWVINDSPSFPAAEKVTGRCAYVRFHGPGARYASSYDDDALTTWAKNVRRFGRDRDVYCYFNNDAHGFAVHNARRLDELIAKR